MKDSGSSIEHVYRKKAENIIKNAYLCKGTDHTTATADVGGVLVSPASTFRMYHSCSSLFSAALVWMAPLALMENSSVYVFSV